ncbi:MAG: orotidine-5'-phosphate decarboxylase [Salibacteraceae bacterium]
MNREELFSRIREKQSFLCVGLDSDIHRLPRHLLNSEDPVFEFNRQIVEATADLCVSYKLNIAFYESQGAKGWKSLERTLEILPQDTFIIADAKRGDIGNTSRLYASAFFENLDFDSVTVAPYMGADSVTPFLDYEGKWVILLALTSNPGSNDFQQLELKDGSPLYHSVIQTSAGWGSPDQLMYVVGATRGSGIGEVRNLAPEHFFLVPGVGAQGGSLEEVAQYGFNDHCGILVNSSRGIIFASEGEDFAEAARQSAQQLQQQMKQLLHDRGLV